MSDDRYCCPLCFPGPDALRNLIGFIDRFSDSHFPSSTLFLARRLARSGRPPPWPAVRRATRKSGRRSVIDIVNPTIGDFLHRLRGNFSCGSLDTISARQWLGGFFIFPRREVLRGSRFRGLMWLEASLEFHSDARGGSSVIRLRASFWGFLGFGVVQGVVLAKGWLGGSSVVRCGRHASNKK